MTANVSGSDVAATEPEFTPDDGVWNPTLMNQFYDAVVGIDYEIDNAIYGFLDAVTNLFAMFPAGPVTEFLQGALLLVRRTFFDQAPILNPVQTSGQTGGEIRGTLGAVDPEGEPIVYSVVIAPDDGTVVINPDGTYVYTPGLDWDGSDAFIVSADDQNSKADLLQGNWIDPTRPTLTDAFVEVDQEIPIAQGVEVDAAAAHGKITFKFVALDTAAKATWRQKNALPFLRKAAFDLAEALNPVSSVTLRYEYGLVDDSLGSMKASFTSKSSNDFEQTTAQAKITGTYKSNAYDGILRIDLRGTDWSYSDDGSVGPGQYVFKRTATHELLHSLGFYDFVSKPGCNAVLCKAGVVTRNPNTEWTWFDQFVGDSNTNRAIIATTKKWQAVPFDRYLTPANNNWKKGLFFVGPNAIQAFGRPVPLYSPTDYSGSSVGHLNNYYFNNKDLTAENALQIMNSGINSGVKAPTKLSPVEIGILKDLGYRM